MTLEQIGDEVYKISKEIRNTTNTKIYFEMYWKNYPVAFVAYFVGDPDEELYLQTNRYDFYAEDGDQGEQFHEENLEMYRRFMERITAYKQP